MLNFNHAFILYLFFYKNKDWRLVLFDDKSLLESWKEIVKRFVMLGIFVFIIENSLH